MTDGPKPDPKAEPKPEAEKVEAGEVEFVDDSDIEIVAEPDDDGIPARDEQDEVESEGDLESAASVVEDDLAKLVGERDEYLGLARRVQADFENFRKRMLKQGADERDRGAGLLVEKLLPALDAFDAALALDEAKVHLRPIYDVLMDVLEKEGLVVLYPAGEKFDPNVHEAVLHEPAEEEGAEPTVVEVLRSGYLWRGKVLRPAIVKVRG